MQSAIKQQAAKACLSGKAGLLGICQKYGIRSDRQLWGWVKVYNNHGACNPVKFMGKDQFAMAV